MNDPIPAPAGPARLNDLRTDLCRHLQAAVQLELTTLPPYIVAAASIRPGSNTEARLRIQSVYMEEMLHMLLAGNVLAALGGTLRLDADTVPTYPARLEFEGAHFRDRRFTIDLRPFSREAIETFLSIELPDGFTPPGAAARNLAPPVAFEGYTIGEFYAHVEDLLTQACGEFGDAAVFAGAATRQLDERYFWFGNGRPVVVNSLASAKDALDLIRHQGEGVPGHLQEDPRCDPKTLAHYYRFNEILRGRAYRAGQSVHDEPAGEPFSVDYAAAAPLRVNPRQADYASGSELARLNRAFNTNYSLMLAQIAEAINGNGYALYGAIRNRMQAIGSISAQMIATALPDDPQGRVGAPSFEWVEPPAQPST